MSIVKRGASFKELTDWVYFHPVKKAIVFIIDKPNLLWHIYHEARKRCEQEITTMRYHMRELIKAGIIRSLTPNLKGKQPGRIYDLTSTGIKIRRMLCQRQRIMFSHIRIKGIDWYKYSKVVLGRQRIALLKALDFSYSLTVNEIVNKTMKFHYKTRGKILGIFRSNVYNTLQKLKKQNLVVRGYFPGQKKKHKPIIKYRLTEEGDLFKRQIFTVFL